MLYNIKVITELKAIHNLLRRDICLSMVVQHQSYYRIESNSQQSLSTTARCRCCTTSKLLQNWKQFTTELNQQFIEVKLYNIKVITELKAIHNHYVQGALFKELYNIKVITELKAIHNIGEADLQDAQVVQHQSYYRIESNSQLWASRQILEVRCTTSKLLQNWKQFTTRKLV